MNSDVSRPYWNGRPRFVDEIAHVEWQGWGRAKMTEKINGRISWTISDRTVLS
ncbi:MAG: hypothetical protein ACYC6Q_08230 [Syntrophales bacterium]